MILNIGTCTSGGPNPVWTWTPLVKRQPQPHEVIDPLDQVGTVRMRNSADETARSPRSDGVETHLNAHLRSGRVDDEIDGSGTTGGDAACEEEVGGRAEGILWARLVCLLLDLRGMSVVVTAIGFVGDADADNNADAEWSGLFRSTYRDVGISRGVTLCKV
jgi:hypothetical protein